MWIRITVLLLLALPAGTLAEITLAWKAPLERADGSAITNQEIEGYNIYCDGDTAPTHSQENTPTRDEKWEVPDSLFSPGDHSCYATTVDTGGLESVPSNSVLFTVAPQEPDDVPPAAPSSLVVHPEDDD